jgi:heterodisulfide reductase subunit A-like polyferredoxin
MISAGFAGISAASCLARQGYAVTVFEIISGLVAGRAVLPRRVSCSIWGPAGIGCPMYSIIICENSTAKPPIITSFSASTPLIR